MRRPRCAEAESLTLAEEAAVASDGERIAEWIVRQARPSIDRQGFAQFHADGRGEVPPWFRVGMAWLYRHPDRWVVVVEDCGGRREYRLFHAYPVDTHDLASFSNASRKADGVAEASFFPSVGLFRSLPRWS